MKRSLKKLLAVTGLLAIAVPASLSVTGCDFQKFLDEVHVPGKGIGTSDQQIVVDAINSTEFSLMVLPGTDASELKSVVCVKFIRSFLPANIQRIYNPSYLFKHDIVNEQGNSITNADLQISRTINARILYDYAEIKDQSARFTLIVE